MTAVWYLEDGKLTHFALPDTVSYEFSPPIPAVWWSVEDGVLTTAVLPPADTHNYVEYPYPINIWTIDENSDFAHAGMPDMSNVGTFMGSRSLNSIVIPETVKYIGEYAFANTTLVNVKIASDCQYSETSFPPGCTIDNY